ncbi:hypothetical protein HMPREF3202_00504 [Prevotella bivia]|uniref:Uncharacterized protein n=1 Tax=Prevotella bivia TaxID=28125 RepID=A0A137SZS1_9BACT|nr:hypothetical protein HMPREF3202_00504 [Prevotella bivia]
MPQSPFPKKAILASDCQHQTYINNKATENTTIKLAPFIQKKIIENFYI